jgi:hypothetical protein
VLNHSRIADIFKMALRQCTFSSDSQPSFTILVYHIVFSEMKKERYNHPLLLNQLIPKKIKLMGPNMG